jgi:hypothetical protein
MYSYVIDLTARMEMRSRKRQPEAPKLPDKINEDAGILNQEKKSNLSTTAAGMTAVVFILSYAM